MRVDGGRAVGGRSCQEIEPLLAAYVDGEGTAAQRDLVLAHLARCHGCREAARGEQAVREAIGMCRGRLTVPASAGLRRRCEACACSPRGWWRTGGSRPSWLPLSFAATMLGAVVVVFVIGLNGGDRALAAQLAIDHFTCFQFGPGRAGIDPPTAAARWKEDYGWLLSIPGSATAE